LQEYDTDVQRTSVPGRVHQLAEVMTAGQWKPGKKILYLGVLDGKKHLLDGRHSLRAVVKSGTTQVFAVEEWAVATHDELVEAAFLLNDHKPHTPTDRLETMGAIRASGLERWQANRIKGAFVFIENRFTRNNAQGLPVPRIAEMLTTYKDSAAAYLAATQSATRAMSNPVHWGITIAVGLVTLQESAKTIENVAEFWRALAHKTNSGTGDPRSLAIDYLLTTAPPNSNGPQRKRTHAHIARYLARCFNAWAAGENLYRVVVDEDKPIVIAGSNFDGKGNNERAVSR